uniref:RRM domain-containing protein n=2 Tax=Alexandrium catenella TaxID=2925 RepID=A0A7S1LW85_ALECA
MTEPPSDRVYISGLPNDMTDAKLKEVFADYGTIKGCKSLNGAAILTLSSIDEAQWMVDNLDGNMPEGIKKPIAVQFAKSSNWTPAGGTQGGGGGWNAGGADRPSPYGGGKGGAGGCKGGGMGMMGKGGSIQMLKQSLTNMGVLPGGKSSKGRSDAQQLCIKGLPPDTTNADLLEICGPFGAIPPNGVKAMLTPEGQCNGIGWVDFNKEEDAAAAMQALNGTTLADGSWLKVHIKNAWKGKGGGGGQEKK